MPKPVKKAAPKKPAAKKRPASDPNRRAGQLMAEHEARMQQGKWADVPTPEPDVAPPHGDPFEAMYRQRMSELGRKGGKASGAKRMENLTDKQRRDIARKAASTRWAKKSRP
jgi:general stress protein YciG